MKNLVLAPILLFTFFACKSDNPKPAPEIEGIVGTWKYVATETIVNDKPEWVSVPGESNVSFRHDGVILDSRNLPNCCAPKAYQVNGEWFVINKDTAREISEKCGPVDCMVCPTAWNIFQTNDELVVFSGCAPRVLTKKYIRE